MTSLTEADYAALERSYLTREIVDAARIQRVDTSLGAEIIGRKPHASTDYAGLIFPYFWPGDLNPREYRLRRDNPDLERKPDGSIKERNKYLSPPGRGNLLYIPPDTPPEYLTDVSIPAVFTEGEKKALALWRFYNERGEKRLVLGLSGVYNFRGVVGKVMNGSGKRQSVSGVIADFDRIEWNGREVLIVFDVNVLTDENVACARRELSREVQRRGAMPSWLNLPTGMPGVNGVDDLLARCGPDFVAGLFLNTITIGAEIWESPAPFDEYDLPVFPLDALPDWLRCYVKELATATQTPPDLAAMLSLANCSAAIAGKVVVRVREDWTEPTNIYNVNALGVGNRKTAVHDAAKAPLEEFEAQLVLETKSKISETKIERDMLAARLEHLKKAAGKADNAEKRKKLIEEAKEIAIELQEKTVSAIPKLIASGDITPEAITSNLADQGGRLFVSSDEGELFQLLAGRYGNGANFEIILKAHTGGKIRVDRRGRSEIIESATLTIGLTVQPDVLRGIAENPAFRARGLTARFLYTLPKSLVGGRNSTPPPLSEEAKQAYAKRLKTLAALNNVIGGGGESTPKVVKLSANARNFLTAFMEEIEPQLAEGGELYVIADWANKLAGAMARLATVLHYAEKSFEPNSILEIPAKAVQDAIKIGRYLIPHALAAYAEMGADPEIEDARKLLRWIKSAKSAADSRFTKREAHRANHNAFPKVTDLEPALNLLEAHGYIRPVESRRKSQIFEINPAVWRAEKRKIRIQDFGDNSDNTAEMNKALLADESDIVTIVTDFTHVDFAHAASADSAQPSLKREVSKI